LACIDLLSLGLIYVKKILQFLSSIKKDEQKRKLVPFFLPHGSAHNSPPKYYLPASTPSSGHGMGAHPYCSAPADSAFRPPLGDYSFPDEKQVCWTSL